MSGAARALESRKTEPYAQLVCGLSNPPCRAVLPTQAVLDYHRAIYHGRNVCGIDGCEERRQDKQTLHIHQKRAHGRPDRAPLSGAQRETQKGNLATRGVPFGGVVGVRKEDNVKKCPECGKEFTGPRAGQALGGHRFNVHKTSGPGGGVAAEPERKPSRAPAPRRSGRTKTAVRKPRGPARRPRERKAVVLATADQLLAITPGLYVIASSPDSHVPVRVENGTVTVLGDVIASKAEALAWLQGFKAGQEAKTA